MILELINLLWLVNSKLPQSREKVVVPLFLNIIMVIPEVIVTVNAASQRPTKKTSSTIEATSLLFA